MPSPRSDTVIPSQRRAKSRCRRGVRRASRAIVGHHAPMLIAIDGPAGAGKSTVAKAVAEALHATYLDTGAMYRCAVLARERDPQADLSAIDVRFEDGRVLLDGEDVSEAIRTPAVSQAAS